MPFRPSLESRTASRHEVDVEENSAATHAIVASLPDRSPDPFSSLALSPDRNHAIVAGKDTLQLIKIDSEGLRTIRSIKIAHHFNVSESSTSIAKSGNAPRRYGDVRDAFQLGPSTPTPRGASMTAIGNITIATVAWSHAMDFGNNMTTTPGTSGMIAEKNASSPSNSQQQEQEPGTSLSEDRDSFVAVAASNGVVVIWSAKQLLFSEPAKTPTAPTRGQGRAGTFSNTPFHHQPEGIINQHVRAVNSLAWHPKRAGLLLTASQDGSVKLWERLLVGVRKPDGTKQPRRPWFAGGGRGNVKTGGRGEGEETPVRTYSWKFKAGFEPKSEAVRDIQWSPYLDDIFGLVTASGSLILYSMHVSVRAMIKIAAHTGDATSLDWHPIRRYDLATGGSGDRTVKVWNLQSALDLSSKEVQDHSSISANSNTWKSELSTNSQSSSETDKSV
jgi:WD repeat-containing protein 24